MKTFTRKCVRDFEQGEFRLVFNQEYLTSGLLEDGTVMVFTNYWARMPIFYFYGEELHEEAKALLNE